MKIVLDFDGTIYSTARRMVDLVKKYHPEAYMGGTWKDVKEYGFKPVINLSEKILQEIFDREDFYIPSYIMEGALEFIEEYQLGGHEVEILTVGTRLNNDHKSMLLEKMGMNIKIFKIETIGTKKMSMDKGSFDANYKGNSIYVDDRLECLKTVKGFTWKFQFSEDGYVLDEDKNVDYVSVTNWDDFERIVSAKERYYE